MMVSVVIPVYNGRKTLAHCLQSVLASDYRNHEIIVVDDCSTDDSPAIAVQFGARLLTLQGKPYGPAFARNQGAEIARGEIVLFVDADITISPDTLSKIVLAFGSHPEFAAMFGSYDRDPSEDDFLSQYKNLIHHFVHQQAKPEASTFWTGCGAIRREVFLKVGGFNPERYPHPSIEDIELGSRVKLSGYRICVNKTVQVKHLKRWTLSGWVKTDVLGRAVPWTRLILAQRSLPNDLNLTSSHRLCAFLAFLMLPFILVAAPIVIVASLLLLTILALPLLANWNFGDGRFLSGMDDRTEMFSLLMLILTMCLLIMAAKPMVLIPLAFILLVLVGQRTIRSPHATVRKLFSASLILSIAFSYGFLLFGSSWLIGTVVSASVALILLLNARLFSFFIRGRNLWFALAAIPFHLIYYIYSVIAFAMGVSLHIRDAMWRSKTNPFASN
jgi:glycosyltransferase involved in cell wall biosynthesis